MPCAAVNILWRLEPMIDRLILEFDRGLRTVFASAPTRRPVPGSDLPERVEDPDQRRHVAALMRIDHAGEVCAQALYQGQSLTCRDPAKRQALRQAAWEETEHLNWTEQRIAELGGHKSYLNPLWYAGSLAIGVAAGKLGDDWNLGFLAVSARSAFSATVQPVTACRPRWSISTTSKAVQPPAPANSSSIGRGARFLPPASGAPSMGTR